MGATHYLTKSLKRVVSRMTLQVLAHNRQRAIAIRASSLRPAPEERPDTGNCVLTQPSRSRATMPQPLGLPSADRRRGGEDRGATIPRAKIDPPDKENSSAFAIFCSSLRSAAQQDHNEAGRNCAASARSQARTPPPPRMLCALAQRSYRPGASTWMHPSASWPTRAHFDSCIAER